MNWANRRERAGPATLVVLAVTLATSGCAARRSSPASPSQSSAAGRADTTRPATAIRRGRPALKSDLDAILNDPALARGTWGVVVRSLKSGETLYALNPRKLLMPASNMKIVTLAAAAEKLGWDYAYDTKLFAGGVIDGGTLAGDLVVVGSGDPSLSLAHGEAERVFAAWADRRLQLGVQTIAGRIVGDDNAFEDETLGFGWSWDDLPDDYAAGIGSLQLNENAVRITVAPGPRADDYAVVGVEPPGSGLDIVSVARTSAAGSQASLTLRRLPGSQRLDLGGTIAAGAPPSVLSVSVENPTLFFAQALRRALVQQGIDVRGAAVDIDDTTDVAIPAGATAVATHRSPPLSTLAMRLMKDSQNQYAETLLKTLGSANGSVATAVAGRAMVQDILDRWGVKAGDLIQRDGSGLSRYDYITADALATILAHLHADARLREPFVASLPIAGRDGSLVNRMKGTPAEGNARAKTGSMSQVRGLSGYVASADGEPLTFSILANNFYTPATVINAATDAIVIRLATFRR